MRLKRSTRQQRVLDSSVAGREDLKPFASNNSFRRLMPSLPIQENPSWPAVRLSRLGRTECRRTTRGNYAISAPRRLTNQLTRAWEVHGNTDDRGKAGDEHLKERRGPGRAGA